MKYILNAFVLYGKDWSLGMNCIFMYVAPVLPEEPWAASSTNKPTFIAN